MTYANLHQFFNSHRVFRRDPNWRLTKPLSGHINALDKRANSSQGVLWATNGILCLIERWDGSLFEGHMDWFVSSSKEQAEYTDGSPVSSEARPNRAHRIAEELLASVIV